MALPATDSFTNTGASNLALTSYSASWTQNTGASWTVHTADYVFPSASAVDHFAHWNADTFDNDQYAQMKIVSKANGIGVAVRVAASASTGYMYQTDSIASYYYRFNSGTGTELESAGSSVAAGATMRIEVSGSVLTYKVNGSTTKTHTDTSPITSGSAGIEGYGTSTSDQGDDWEGGNLSSGGATLSAALAAATALSLASTLNSGAALAGQLGSATAASLISSLVGGAQFSGQAGQASALSPNGGLLAGLITLFSDGFESGNVSAWSDSQTDGTNTLTISGGYAHDGSYGLRSLGNATGNLAFVSSNQSTPASNIFSVQYWLYFVSTSDDAWGIWTAMIQGTGYVTIATVQRRNGTWELKLRNKDGTIQQVALSTQISSNTWTKVEITYQWASQPVAKCYVNGTLAATATDTTTGSAYSLLRAVVGIYNSEVSYTSWEAWYDTVTIANGYQSASPNGTLACALAAAAALSLDAGLKSGGLLAAILGAASALSPSGAFASGSTLVAQAAVATGLSPNSSLASGGVLAAVASLASALSGVSTMLGSSGNVALSAVLALAQALSGAAGMAGGAVMPAGVTLASTLSPTGAFTSGGVVLASLTMATAASLIGSLTGMNADGLLLAGLPAANAVSPVVSFRAQRIVIGRGMLRSGGRFVKIGSGTR